MSEEFQNSGSWEIEQKTTGGVMEPFSVMPIPRNERYYNMSHKHRGMALIFNHEHFDIHSLECRTGTSVDSDNFAKILEGLGFTVTVLQDLKANEVKQYIHNTAEMDHSDFDCVLIAVLTHGEKGGTLYAKDTHYKSESLWHCFTDDKCPTLAGKPKLFFIQACQGVKLDDGKTLVSEIDGPSKLSIIHDADFLIALSTVPGYIAWRNITRGSWFIQALCEELRHSGTELHILTLLTFVCQRVALDWESYTPDEPSQHQRKQVSCIISTLTRLLVFKNK